MPAAWKNSAISFESGAPPDTAKRRRPPSAACSFENTSLWASRCLKARPGGAARPGRPRRLRRRDLASHPPRPVEDLPLDRRAGLRPGEVARVDLLEDTR